MRNCHINGSIFSARYLSLKLMSMIIVDKNTFGMCRSGGLEVETNDEIRNLHFQELDIKISLVIWLSQLYGSVLNYKLTGCACMYGFRGRIGDHFVVEPM